MNQETTIPSTADSAPVKSGEISPKILCIAQFVMGLLLIILGGSLGNLFDRIYYKAEMTMTSNCSRDLDCTGEFRSHY